MNCPICNKLLVNDISGVKLECPEIDSINPEHRFEIIDDLDFWIYKGFKIMRRKNPISILSFATITREHETKIVKSYSDYPTELDIINDVDELYAFMKCPLCQSNWQSNGLILKTCNCGMIPINIKIESNSFGVKKYALEVAKIIGNYEVIWNKFKHTCVANKITNGIITNKTIILKRYLSYDETSDEKIKTEVTFG